MTTNEEINALRERADQYERMSKQAREAAGALVAKKMPEAITTCATCGAPLNWRGGCDLCARFTKLAATVAELGGFRARKPSRKIRQAKTWQSGVDNSLPNGDKEL